MKVLFITGAYPPMHCGVGDYTFRLVGALEAVVGVIPGVLTSVAASGAVDRPSNFFPVMDVWDLPSLSRVIDILRQFRPDIVHLQYPASFGRVFMPNFLPIVCKALGITMVQTWHEHPIYSQMINALPSDTLVVVDPAYPGAYCQPYRAMVRHKRSVYIPIGANIPQADLSMEERNQIRINYHSEGFRLIVYFGFAIPQKGIEYLFYAANPEVDRLVLICELDPKDSYHASIIRLAESPEWRGKCCVTGYLEDQEVASLLASADAAVFPFVVGSTQRNGSVLAARLQGTFVVTTHTHFRGYIPSENTYYVVPGDAEGIRVALDSYAGIRLDGEPCVADWNDIATRHIELYQGIVKSLNRRVLRSVNRSEKLAMWIP
jgi:glycosyltransferase involved in cell wall biosynthesis